MEAVIVALAFVVFWLAVFLAAVSVFWIVEWLRRS